MCDIALHCAFNPHSIVRQASIQVPSTHFSESMQSWSWWHCTSSCTVIKFSLCIMHFLKIKLMKNIRNNIYQSFCMIHLYQWWCLVGNCISLYEEELCLIPCILDLQNTYWRIDKDLDIWCWYTRSMMDIRYLICILVRWKHLREKKRRNYSSFLFDIKIKNESNSINPYQNQN